MKKVIFLVSTSGSFGSWTAGEEAEISETIADGFIAHGNAVLKEVATKTQKTVETATKK
jgi:hypothetical protein